MKANLKFLGTATLMFGAFLSFSHPVRAYDEDTHFYATYSMARFAGIRHAVAVKIALGAQWMDESYISDPTSMIFLPITGIKKRQLLHFPSSRIVGSVSATTQKEILGLENISAFQENANKALLAAAGGDARLLDGMTFVTETEENHPFASQLMMEGLKEGSLMKCSASLHVLEDSFAHAGTPAEQGHALFWHWPDRAFAYPDKYFRMVRKLLPAIAAIRAQLPGEALDCNLKLGFEDEVFPKPNCQKSGKELAEAYSKIPTVVSTVTHDVLKDQDYLRTALDEFYDRGSKGKYLKMSKERFDELFNSLPLAENPDAYSLFERLISKTVGLQMASGEQLIDMPFILSDLGKLDTVNATPNIDIKDYVESWGDDSPDNVLESEGFKNFTHAIAYDLLLWHVPTPLSDTHRGELEDDKGPIRKKEMEIRIANMQKLIAGLYGINIELVPNNTKDQTGFGKEIRKEASAEPVFPDKKGVFYASFTMREKSQWDRMIFRYLFPSLRGYDANTILDVFAEYIAYAAGKAEYDAKSAEITSSNDSLWSKGQRLIQLNRDYSYVLTDGEKTLSDVTLKINPLMPQLVHDLLSTHLTPSPDNLYYANRDHFKAYQTSGVIKPLLGDADFWSLKDLEAQAASQGAY